MKTLIKYRRSAVLFLLMFTVFCLAVYSWADFFSRTQFLVAWTIFGLMWLAFLYGESKKLIAIILAALMAAPSQLNAVEPTPPPKTEKGEMLVVAVGVCILIAAGVFVWWMHGKCKKDKANPPKRGIDKEMEEQDKQAACKRQGPPSCVAPADTMEDEAETLILTIQIGAEASKITKVEIAETGFSKKEIYQTHQELGVPPEPYQTVYSRNGEPISADESSIEFLDDDVIRIKGGESRLVTLQTSMDLETWTDVQTFDVPIGMKGVLWVDGQSKQSYWRIAQ